MRYALHLMFGDLDAIEATRGDARHPKNPGGVQSHVMLRRLTRKRAREEDEKAAKRAVILEMNREFLARMHAGRREKSRQHKGRQIRLILKHPSRNGVEMLARLASDLAQSDEVRADAAAAILKLAFGPIYPLEDE